MITIMAERFNGERFIDDPRQVSVSRALTRLVKYELGFGGKVTSISKNQITVETQVLNCHDTTTFAGSEEEMKPLYEAATFFMVASDRFHASSIEAVFNRLQEVGLTSAFALTAIGPILVGQTMVKTAMVLACGIQDETEVRQAVALETDDFYSVLELALETGKSVSSLRQQLGV